MTKTHHRERIIVREWLGSSRGEHKTYRVIMKTNRTKRGVAVYIVSRASIDRLLRVYNDPDATVRIDGHHGLDIWTNEESLNG
jgi:hypothetical protein